MSRARIIKGVGRDVNPLDGDKVVIELGVRDGKVAHVGAGDIRTGVTTWVGEQRKHIEFRTGMQAKVHGETFAGCETARNAALILYKVFTGLQVDQALALGVSDIIAKMDAPPENERCVMTVLGAVRNALIDVQITVLAEATVEVRRLREAG
jgi:hypothetical protein